MMRLLFIGPSHCDDPRVHEITNIRVQIAKDVINNVRYPDDEVRANGYADFLRIAQEQSEPIDDIACLFSNLGEEREIETLMGDYSSHRHLMDRVLPALQARITLMGCPGFVHVDAGASITSLYAAYFASLEADISLTVSFHVPEEGEPFAIGGRSFFAKQRPFLRRRLAATILDRAEFVFVPDERLAGGLKQLFPQIVRTFSLDPLVGQLPDPVQSELFVEAGSA